MTKNEGLFADDGLEIWIDLIAAMTTPMRRWACKALLGRKAALRGGNSAPPHICQTDSGAYEHMTQVEGMIFAYTSSAIETAKVKGSTPAQLDQMKAYFAADFKANLTPVQVTAMDGTLESNLLVTLTAATQKTIKACLAKVGL